MTSGDALRVKDLRVSYGGIAAVKELSLDVDKGEIVTLIGANGAGKTSTLKAIVGLVPIQAGEVTLFGESLRGVPTHRIAGRGVALVSRSHSLSTHHVEGSSALASTTQRRRSAACSARSAAPRSS